MRQLVWRKSSYSSDQGGACVQVADLPGHHAVRDSKNPTGTVLQLSTAAWSVFTTAVRGGEFD